jgi:thiamine-monophosphate kinase
VSGGRRARSAAIGGEDRLIAWLRRTLGPPASGLLGDDAAMLPLDGEWALTVDSQIEGTHFLRGLDPAVVARRLLAVNLSDLAAVGAAPAYALLALAAPPGFDHRRFLRAFAGAVRAAGVTLAGGDLARAPQVVATLTLLGRRRPRGRFLRRDEARAGDALWVGGTLGESALGRLLVARGARLDGRRVTLPAPFNGGSLAAAARAAVRRHLLPVPQLALSAELARRRRGSCIDVSDGLVKDLSRLCAASGVGAIVEATALPFAPRAVELAGAFRTDAEALALSGGEDYALLFTLPARARPPRGCHRIGSIDDAGGVRLRRGGGQVPLRASGWDHLAP